MSERYTRLYKLPENLYYIGAPVLIKAGALLKDNQTGKILSQLKIKNIGVKAIKAVTVKIVPFDTASRELETSVNYQYLDLNVSRDNYFGEQVPIEITNLATRSFSVAIVEVIFSDNSVWNSDGEIWTEKINFIDLDKTLVNSELIKQYKINLQLSEAKYLPHEEADLWVCTCGAINRIEEQKCHCCKNTLTRLQENLNVEKLKQDIDSRVVAEKVKAEEEHIKIEVEKKQIDTNTISNKKNSKKKLMIGVTVVCSIFLLFMVLLFSNSSNLIVGEWHCSFAYLDDSGQEIPIPNGDGLLKIEKNKTFVFQLGNANISGVWEYRGRNDDGGKYYKLSTNNDFLLMVEVKNIDGAQYMLVFDDYMIGLER